MDNENETTTSNDLPTFADHLTQAAFALGATVVVYVGAIAICSIPSAVQSVKGAIKARKDSKKTTNDQHKELENA